MTYRHDTVEFAGKLARIADDGSIEVSRLMNARTGELAWNKVPRPTPALVKATQKLRKAAK